MDNKSVDHIKSLVQQKVRVPNSIWGMLSSVWHVVVFSAKIVPIGESWSVGHFVEQNENYGAPLHLLVELNISERQSVSESVCSTVPRLKQFTSKSGKHGTRKVAWTHPTLSATWQTFLWRKFQAFSVSGNFERVTVATKRCLLVYQVNIQPSMCKTFQRDSKNSASDPAGVEHLSVLAQKWRRNCKWPSLFF